MLKEARGLMVAGSDARYLTIARAAEYLQVSVRHFNRVKHEIPAARIGRKLIFDRNDLDRYVQSRKSNPGYFSED